MLDLAEMHLDLVSNSNAEETLSQHDGTLELRITKLFVQYKYPSDTELAGKSISEIEQLPLNLQLRYHRLRARMTIDEAAVLAHIDRCTLMNYEQGKTTRMKSRTIKRLMEIYHKLREQS